MKSNKSETTWTNKKRRLEAHISPGLGHYRVKDLNQTILDRYAATMARGSYRTDLYHLLALISWMVQRRMAEPLTWKPEIPDYSAPVRLVPDPADVLNVIDNLKRPDLRALFTTMLFTGLRWREARYLRWDNYQNGRIRMTATKTKQQEIIHLPEQIIPWYEENKKPTGWIFSYNGRHPYRGLWRALHLACQQAGVHMTPHLFRHASATFLYESTEDIYAVQHHLRHSRVTTSQIYTRYSAKRRQTAVKSIVDYVVRDKKE